MAEVSVNCYGMLFTCNKNYILISRFDMFLTFFQSCLEVIQAFLKGFYDDVIFQLLKEMRCLLIEFTQKFTFSCIFLASFRQNLKRLIQIEKYLKYVCRFDANVSVVMDQTLTPRENKTHKVP